MAITNGTNGTNGATKETSNGAVFDIPTEMKAIRYNKIRDWSLVTMPVPSIKPHEILVKGQQLSMMSQQNKVANNS